jgi:hypothetical protein
MQSYKKYFGKAAPAGERKNYYTKRLLHEVPRRRHKEPRSLFFTSCYFVVPSCNEKETYSFKGTVKISTQFPVEQ